jgi:geranylgeranyl reductase
MKFSIVAVASVVTVASAFTAPKSSFMGQTSVSQVANSNGSNLDMRYKVAVVGGGPSGACAAEIFAQEKGIDTVMFERKMDNAKPCGGAIPLCMVGEFDIPEAVVDRKVRNQNNESLVVLLYSYNETDIGNHSNSCKR